MAFIFTLKKTGETIVLPTPDDKETEIDALHNKETEIDYLPNPEEDEKVLIKDPQELSDLAEKHLTDHD